MVCDLRTLVMLPSRCALLACLLAYIKVVCDPLCAWLPAYVWVGAGGLAVLCLARYVW